MAEVTVGGLRFHVQRLGPEAGVPVVFLHGLIMDNLSSWFFTAAPKVAAHQPVVLYDLRGHGKSERPATGYGVQDMVEDLCGILDESLPADQRVELVGNSFGGLLALAFALARPERVRACASWMGRYMTRPLAPRWRPAWVSRVASVTR